MKKSINNLIKLFSLVLVIVMILCCVSISVSAKDKKVMTRQGDTVWFGLYPQTKATDEELSNMSASPNADGFFTSGKDLFVKINNANPKVHSETADTVYIPFNDNTQPVEGETYYFKLEPIEWMVLVDDEDNDAVTLVSRYYLDTHAWQTEANDGKCTKAGVPENTPANSWRYSEMRAFLNDEFLNFAFTEEEKEAIYLFGNTHTIDYRSNDESTIVNDYVVIGNRDDYDKAGNNGRPTDYTIVRGATWCYNKDHIYYYVNAIFPTFGSGYVRLYRHDEHEKVASVDSVEAIRPIVNVKRSAAKILATETQKETGKKNTMLIIGIVAVVVGAVIGVPVMYSTSKKYKLQKQNDGTEYKLNKKEVGRIIPGILLMTCGCVLIVLFVMFNGGIGGAKLSPGVYVQESSYGSSGGVAQVGKTAYRLNADGTFDYTGYYEGAGSAWESHGTYTQNGSSITFVYDANPMVPAGYRITAPIINSTSFGSTGDKFVKEG